MPEPNNTNAEWVDEAAQAQVDPAAHPSMIEQIYRMLGPWGGAGGGLPRVGDPSSRMPPEGMAPTPMPPEGMAPPQSTIPMPQPRPYEAGPRASDVDREWEMMTEQQKSIKRAEQLRIYNEIMSGKRR